MNFNGINHLAMATGDKPNTTLTAAYLQRRRKRALPREKEGGMTLKIYWETISS